MTFAALPAALVGALMALAAALVIGVYLLRRTPQLQVVSNIQFWLRAAESARPKWLASFRIPLVALLLSLIVGLLIVALAGDPRFGDGVRGTTVIVLASGRTMGARAEGGERRIDRAVVEVRRWVERSTIEGDVAVIRAGMRPSVLLPVTERAGDLEQALRDLSVDDGPADLESALAVADQLLIEHLGADTSRGRILLVTDTAFEPATVAHTVILPVGTPVDTLAITSFAARRVPTAVGEYAARIEVANFSSREASVRIEIADGEVPILDERIVLLPHEHRALDAGGFSARRAELVASLEGISIAGSSDGLPADDRAHAVVEALERTRVLLVTDGDLYLEAALSAHPGLEVEVLNRAGLSSETRSSLSSYAAIVLDQVAPPAALSHPSVLSFAPPEGGPVTLRREIRNPRITAMLGSHPALEGVRFDGVHFERARPIAEETGDQVLLRAGDRALAIARTGTNSRLVVFSFDTEDTDLVRGEAFPLLVHHALRWVADHGEPTPLARRVGSPLTSEAGLTITDPSGTELAVTTVPTVTEAGIWDLGGRRIAFDATEHARALGAGATGGTFAAASLVPPLSMILAAILLIVMLLEWTLLHRGRLE
jgi:Ca-activated chloride channel family protein